MNLMPLIYFGGVAVTVIILVSRFLKANQLRAGALRIWAQQRGWSYAERDDAILSRFHGAPFTHGPLGKTADVMTGTFANRRAAVFAYKYAMPVPAKINSGSVNSDDLSSFRIFAVEMPSALGSFSVKPEGTVTKAGTQLGLPDIQLESEAFNKAFRLTASSQKLAYDLVPARTIDLLLNHPNADLHTDGNTLIAVEPDSPSTDGLDATFALLTAFIDNVPPFVWKDHGVSLSTDEPPAS